VPDDAATRWVTDNSADHSRAYVARFRKLAADGADLDGEARLLDAMIPRGARVLDAGCGTGRVGAALAARGHDVVGVDADAVLLAAAASDHPGPRWIEADLARLDLAPFGEGRPFDAAVLAGNVLVYVAPGTESAVLDHIARHLVADGVIVVGFATGRGYEVHDLDQDVSSVGLLTEHRFATWDLRPWRDDSSFAVSILRRV
jgi:SAM-dependent methyltransferase